jgi:hypothetical protein
MKSEMCFVHGQKSKFCAQNALEIILLTGSHQENSSKNSVKTKKAFVVEKISFCSRP